MQRKTVGNQIHGRGLDEQQLKTQSPAVEMFPIGKMAHFRANIEAKCHE